MALQMTSSSSSMPPPDLEIKDNELGGVPVTFVNPGVSVVIQDDFYFLDEDVEKSIEPSGSESQPTVYIEEEDDENIPFALVSMVELENDDDDDGVVVDDLEASDASQNDENNDPTDEEDDSAQDAIPAQPLPEDPGTSTSFPRPEFLFVNAIKPKASSPVGLAFRKIDGSIYIARVKPNSLFDRSGLQVGDKVLAVNHVDCTAPASLNQMLRIIKSTESTISFCVQNEGGDPNCFLSSVQKPTRSCKLGVCFQMRRGALTISYVHEDSLFAGSLLMSNHRCFMINGQLCDNKGAQAAADHTATLNRVTIISRPRDDMAAVVSISEEDQIPPAEEPQPLSRPRRWTRFAPRLLLSKKLRERVRGGRASRRREEEEQPRVVAVLDSN